MYMELHLPYKLLLLSVASSLVAGYLFPLPEFIQYPYGLAASFLTVIVGISLGLWVKRTILLHRTTLNPDGQPTSLITTGLFRLSRNPMYVSYLIVAFGFALYSAPVALLGPVAYFLYLNYKIIPREEQKLRQTFPVDYTAYAEKVRRWV